MSTDPVAPRPPQRHRRLAAALVATCLVAGLVALVVTRDDPDGVTTANATSTTRATTTSRPVSTTTAAPSTSVAPTTAVPATAPPAPTEPPTTAAPTSAPPPAADPVGLASTPVGGGRYTFEPYGGLGAWVDVYDWTLELTNGNPGVGLAQIERMASLGVQTLYLQPVRWDAADGVFERDRLLALIDRAHAVGMRVVAWYLPDLGDVSNDQRHLQAIADLPVEGLGIDIESRKVEDVDLRNERLVALSSWLRQLLPGEVLSAIVLPPVVMEDVNPNYWGPADGPGFPWAALAPLYDVWQTMGYWTNRIGGWSDAYQYTAVNIDRVRAYIGNPDAVVHPVGGIGDETTPDDVAAMARAASERGAVGGSLYDYRTTGDDLWAPLQAFRTG